jgi:hypothetical protein
VLKIHTSHANNTKFASLRSLFPIPSARISQNISGDKRKIKRKNGDPPHGGHRLIPGETVKGIALDQPEFWPVRRMQFPILCASGVTAPTRSLPFSMTGNPA